ncbi:MAG: histidine phosphatase family protein [Bacteroidia bacterium]
MKTLILLRHGKSEDPSLLKSDFKRGLKQKGIDDIEKVCHHFKALGYSPDKVLCSTARRTRETFDEFSKHYPSSIPVEYIDNLYHASASKILEYINKNIYTLDCLMVVGHNFGISKLAEYLCIGGCEDLSTSGMVIIQFDDLIEPGLGTKLHYIKPKLI